MNAILELRHLDALAGDPAVQAIGWALLQFVWQGALIGLLAAVTLAALRRSAADVRYVVATIALALMLTIPVVTAVQGIMGSERSSPAPTAPSRQVTAISPATARETAAAPRLASQPHEVTAVPEASRMPGAPGPIEALTPWLLLIWTAGVMLLTLRLLSGWLWIQRLKTHGASPAHPSLRQIGERLARRLHVPRAAWRSVDVDERDDADDHDNVCQQAADGDGMVGISLARACVPGQGWQHSDHDREKRDGNPDRHEARREGFARIGDCPQRSEHRRADHECEEQLQARVRKLSVLCGCAVPLEVVDLPQQRTRYGQLDCDR